MAEVLLINIQQIKYYTSLGGNVDSDYITPFVKIAQDKNIIPLIGTKLMDKLKELVEAGAMSNTGNEIYKGLHDVIKPCLAHFFMVEYIPFNTYKMKNSGTGQSQPENSTPVTLAEMNNLVEIERQTAMVYLDRIDKYICANESGLPEYNSNETGDVYPGGNEPFNGLTY